MDADGDMQLGGPSWDVKVGRRDSTTASFRGANNNIPPPTSGLANLTSLFAAQGLSQKDMVALSGTYVYVIIYILPTKRKRRQISNFFINLTGCHNKKQQTRTSGKFLVDWWLLKDKKSDSFICHLRSPNRTYNK